MMMSVECFCLFDVRRKNTDLFTPLIDSCVLDCLLQYYQKNPEQDALHQLLVKISHADNLVKYCLALFGERWLAAIPMKYRNTLIESEVESSIEDSLWFQLTCTNLAEATLCAQLLETALYEKFNIPYRSSVKHILSLDIIYRNDNRTDLFFIFQPEDYLKVTKSYDITLTDTLLFQTFLHPGQDYNHYCQAKYGVHLPQDDLVKLPIQQELDPELNVTALAAISSRNSTDFNAFSARALVVSRTGAGSGNYINARITIEQLCQKMPHLKVDWIIANDSDPLPRTGTLPKQVTLYETDALWKLYPLIQWLSIDADIVTSLPNSFLYSAEDFLKTKLVLSHKCVQLTVFEYLNYKLFQ